MEEWWKESVWVEGFDPSWLQQNSARLGNEESHWPLLMTSCSCFFGSSSVDTLHRSRNSLLCSGKSFSGWSLLRLTVLRKKKTCSLAFLFIYVGGILIIKIKIINSPAQVLWDIQSDRRNVCDLLYFFPIDAQCSVVMCLTWISISPCAFEPASPSLVSCYFELEQVKPLFLLYDTICVLIWNFCWLWSFPNKHWNCPKYLLSTLQWGSALPG